MTSNTISRKLVAAGALAVCANASAQGSVTLYGTVDAGLTYTTNQQFTSADGSVGSGHNYAFSGGNLVPSRFGFLGVEDLGGGLQAKFMLENSFYTGSGNFVQGGAQFNRQAWLGLAHEQFGTLSFGRQYDSYSDFLGVYVSSNSWATLYGSHIGDVDNLNEAFNFNNAIKYTSPDWNGFSLGGTYSLGGVAGDYAQRRGYALAAAYTRLPVSLSAGYLNLRNPLDAALGGANGYIGDFACSNPTALYCQLQNAEALKAYGAGASYAIGPATIALIYTHSRLEHSQYFADSANPHGRNVGFDIGEVNLTYAATPFLQLGLAYIYNNAKVDGGSSTRFHQVNLGANYALSKRTALYGVAIMQKAVGAGLGTDPATGASANYAQIPNLPNSNSDRQLSVTLGIRHNF
ncbi:porin [Caballeronia insecticola]|uniref:Porin Gram-negative type n=1 Tax=Caballeronia insecticola TaxID=758793 RepID=R4WLF2_9BURK|nr:porin [Caballeronia insecticola]BAN25413.1 porin Gram-negative type [Caballeronia insecticola]